MFSSHIHHLLFSESQNEYTYINFSKRYRFQEEKEIRKIDLYDAWRIYVG